MRPLHLGSLFVSWPMTNNRFPRYLASSISRWRLKIEGIYLQAQFQLGCALYLFFFYIGWGGNFWQAKRRKPHPRSLNEITKLGRIRPRPEKKKDEKPKQKRHLFWKLTYWFSFKFNDLTTCNEFFFWKANSNFFVWQRDDNSWESSSAGKHHKLFPLKRSGTRRSSQKEACCHFLLQKKKTNLKDFFFSHFFFFLLYQIKIVTKFADFNHFEIDLDLKS